MAKKKNKTRADGRIAVQVYLGMVDGKRKYKTVYGSTQKEADEKALEVKLQMRKGIDVTCGNDSWDSWAKRWADNKRLTVSAGQMGAYDSCVKHLSGYLGAAPITKIKTIDIQDVVNALSANNPNTGKPASYRMLEIVKITASQIFQLAIDNRVMDYNPANAVKIPSGAPAETRRALTEEERSWIIDTPHTAQRPAMLCLFAGLRRGEVIPLTWDDIDLQARTIDVNKSVEMIHGKPVVKQGAKTDSGVRTVDIPQILVDFLTGEKAKDASKQQQTVMALHPLVCPDRRGNMYNTQTWGRMWRSYLIDLNLKYGDFSGHLRKPKSKYDPAGVPMVIPHFTAHWLRHTFATMLYMAGVDVLTAKEQLGHSNISTTLKIYTHLDATYKRRAMDKLDAYLTGDASQMQVNI